MNAYIYGLAKAFDIGGFLNRSDEILNKSDAEVLADDWKVVGNDLRKAMDMFEDTIKEKH